MPASFQRGELVQAARDELSTGRSRLAELHDRGLDAVQICARMASLIDGVLQRLFSAAADAFEKQSPKFGEIRRRVALVELGSHGRRQAAPYSDVDLMILHDGIGEALTPLVRSFTQSIYDAGLQLGYSVRSSAEAVQLARGDAVICSSLIDCRLLAGDQPLFEGFRDVFARMVRRRAKSVARQLEAARNAERDQYGESVYALEPHVKRSRGGLRDLHLIRWFGFIDHGEADPERLHLLGALSKLELRRYQSAQALLLRLRNEMHFHAGTAKDLLDRAEQLRIAEKFGYRGSSGLLPVEQFMRDYFRHTNHLWQLVRRREVQDSPSTISRVLDPVLGRTVAGDVKVGVSTVSATPAGLARVRGDIEAALELVEISVREQRPLDQAAWGALLLGAPECPEDPPPAAIERFLRMLADSAIAADALAMLHELGYLERFIPAMKHARCLLQFNQYHKYTVDEHCLLAVRRATEFAKRDGFLGDAYRAVKNKRVLHLALLMHDLGKGYEGDHSEVGAELTRETCQRLGLGAADADDAVFLVRRHLMMSHLAFRRDTSDPRVLAEFAETVRTTQRLRMLFTLTCADLAAVGPDVLTDWKVEVLGALLQRTLAELGVGLGGSDTVGIAERRRQTLRHLTDFERADEWFRRHAEALPSSVLIACEPRLVAEALRRFHRLTDGGAVAWGFNQTSTKTVEFLAGIDQGPGRGAFSAMAGALASRGLEILAADSETLPDDLLLLRYVALDPQNPEGTPQGRLDEIGQAMAAAVGSDEPPKFRRVWGQDRAAETVKLTQLPPRVRIDVDGSADCTIVEVFTFDRLGLLYDLAHKLHKLELTIRHAKIGTYLDQVVDVFYVSDRDYRKVTDEAKLETIRAELLAVIAD
ncbi:MAG: HD domain-containing protein [Planctomycetales bacterium]|nr:HD domain-containing protein [Planctomycetales bacterium]